MSQTKTWVGLAVLLGLVLVAGTWFGAISPVLTRTSDTQDSILDAKARTDQLTVQLATLAKQYEEIDTYRAELSELEAQIPSEAEMADYRRVLSTAATESGVTILTLSSGSPMPTQAASAPAAATTDSSEASNETAGENSGDDAADTAAPQAAPAGAQARLVGVPMNITVLGTYANSMAFLNKVQSQVSRLMLIGSISSTSQTETPAGNGLPATAAGDIELSLDGYVMVLPDSAAAEPETDADAVDPVLPTSARNPFVPVN
jgi:Tfp pilus assembly protein PilO